MSKFTNNLFQGGAAAFKSNILHNYVVLYFIVFITFFNLVSFAIYGHYATLAIFFMVAIITSFFSKNMIVIITVGLVVANLLALGPKHMQVEGMADHDENEESEEETLKDVAKSEKISPKLNVEHPMASTSEKSKVNLKQYRDRKKDFDYIKSKYSELLKVQEKIMSNVGSLEGSMTNMDNIVDDVKKNLDTIRDTIPA